MVSDSYDYLSTAGAGLFLPSIMYYIIVNGSSPAVSSSAIEPTATSVPTANSSDVLSLSIVPPSQTVLSTSLSDEGVFKHKISMNQCKSVLHRL